MALNKFTYCFITDPFPFEIDSQAFNIRANPAKIAVLGNGVTPLLGTG